MQNIQTSEFLHILGHFRVPLVTETSSKGDGATRQFRGYFYGGVFSLGLGGGVWGLFPLFHHPFQFPVPVRSAILNRAFRIFHRNFVNFVRRVLDITLIPSGSVLKSPAVMSYIADGPAPHIDLGVVTIRFLFSPSRSGRIVFFRSDKESTVSLKLKNR